jgi:hypothetical protein
VTRADPTPTTGDQFLVGRWLFLRILGIVYLFAFLSLADQIVGLIGAAGLVPAADSLAQHRAVSGDWAFLRAPSIFWLTTDDAVLEFAMWLGVGVALLLIIDVRPRLVLLVLWLL